MGNSVESVSQENVATPLASDFLDKLRGQLSGGQLGLGLGPLQREAGTAARQVVASGGLDPRTVEAVNRVTNENALNLREGFGIAGSRFGTPLALGESKLRSDAAVGLGALGAERQNEAIGMLQQFGLQNLAPFIQLASLGILPPQLFEKGGPLSFLGDIVGIGAGALTGGAAAGLFGGGNGAAGDIGNI